MDLLPHQVEAAGDDTAMRTIYRELGMLPPGEAGPAPPGGGGGPRH